MIFADKLIQLRKKSGWSQEELADQMKVSRQSVSKWEGAQSVPDLEKIVRLSQLFGVSTDYLLKDEIEEEETPIRVDEEESLTVKRVTMEEASAFLAVKEATAKPIAYGVFLCILSPICLFILAAASEIPSYHIAEAAAAGIGMSVLLVQVTIAVALFISAGNKTSQYEYLEKEVFETEYGVTGMVKERRDRFKETYNVSCVIGAGICILSVIPLFCGMMIDEDNDLFAVCMLSVMLVLVGIGVVFFIRSGIVWESYRKLLQEGEYTKQNKQHPSIQGVAAVVYWMLAIAIFFISKLWMGYSWSDGWIVWAVAGVLYPALWAVISVVEKKKV